MEIKRVVIGTPCLLIFASSLLSIPSLAKDQLTAYWTRRDLNSADRIAGQVNKIHDVRRKWNPPSCQRHQRKVLRIPLLLQVEAKPIPQ